MKTRVQYLELRIIPCLKAFPFHQESPTHTLTFISNIVTIYSSPNNILSK